MRIAKKKQGQFIIIAALLIAIMMVSASTIMYGAVTYYRHERWEEYLAIIDNVELGSRRVVEISLANYTLTLDDTTLKDNLGRWQNDIRKAYAGFGIVLTYLLTDDCGLTHMWFQRESFSAANATFTMNITSVGLSGYKFITPVFLRMNITDASWDNDEQELIIQFIVDKEGSVLVSNLKKDNFSLLVDGETEDFTLVQYYKQITETYGSFIYEIHCSPPQPSLISVTAIDTRGIKVIANSTVTELD